MVCRTREIADTPEKGQTRYQLYKSVIDRYKDAMKAGYYLEAITLMESLITDRLESAMIYHGVIRQTEAFRMLGDCINRLKNTTIVSSALLHDLNAWKNARNSALHEMAKIEAGTKPTFTSRYAEYQRIAKSGYYIFSHLKKELKH